MENSIKLDDTTDSIPSTAEEDAAPNEGIPDSPCRQASDGLIMGLGEGVQDTCSNESNEAEGGKQQKGQRKAKAKLNQKKRKAKLQTRPQLRRIPRQRQRRLIHQKQQSQNSPKRKSAMAAQVKYLQNLPEVVLQKAQQQSYKHSRRSLHRRTVHLPFLPIRTLWMG